MTQEILCVRRASLEERFGGQIPLGFTPDVKSVATIEQAVREIGEIRPRPALEEDPAFLQLIVQGLVARDGLPLALFRAVRAARGDQFVETRHNAKIALSAGGHVEPVEASVNDVLRAALQRELQEELVFERPPVAPTIEPLGVVCNASPDASLFNRVHIGLVFLVPTTGGVTLPPASDEFTHLEFADMRRLQELSPRMEGWGQLLSRAILDGTLVLRSSAPIISNKDR